MWKYTPDYFKSPLENCILIICKLGGQQRFTVLDFDLDTALFWLENLLEMPLMT